MSCRCHNENVRSGRIEEERVEVMEDLSVRELLALKEIHLTGQAFGQEFSPQICRRGNDR